MNQSTKKLAIGMAAANGVYATAVVGLFSNDTLRTHILSAWPWALLGLFSLELATLASVWFLYRDGKKRRSDPVPFEIDIERIDIRFAKPSDNDGTEEVYLEYFTDDMSIDESEFNKIVARGVHVRVAEAVFPHGSTQLVGYYSIWPIKRETYDALVNGKLKEHQFTASDVHLPSSKNAEVLYVSEICVRRGSSAGSMLLRDAKSYVCAIARRNNKVTLIAAWGSTPMGRSIAVRMCMTRVRTVRGRLTQFYEIGRGHAFRVLSKATAFRSAWSVTFSGCELDENRLRTSGG